MKRSLISILSLALPLFLLWSAGQPTVASSLSDWSTELLSEARALEGSVKTEADAEKFEKQILNPYFTEFYLSGRTYDKGPRVDLETILTNTQSLINILLELDLRLGSDYFETLSRGIPQLEDIVEKCEFFIEGLPLEPEPTDEGEPAETHELCAYQDSGGNLICINGTQNDKECVSPPQCRADQTSSGTTPQAGSLSDWSTKLLGDARTLEGSVKTEADAEKFNKQVVQPYISEFYLSGRTYDKGPRVDLETIIANTEALINILEELDARLGSDYFNFPRGIPQLQDIIEKCKFFIEGLPLESTSQTSNSQNTCKRVENSECSKYGPPIQNPIINPTATPTDLGGLIGQVFNWSLSVIGLVVFVMILFSGFQWLTAAGNPGQIGEARNRMTNALLGAALLLSAYLILNVINPNLVRQTSTLPALPGGSSQTPAPTPATTLPVGTPTPRTTPVGSGSVGGKCSGPNDCNGQLLCADNICQRIGGNELGEACVNNNNCNQDLFLLCNEIEQQVIDGQTLGTCTEEGF